MGYITNNNDEYFGDTWVIEWVPSGGKSKMASWEIPDQNGRFSSRPRLITRRYR